MSAERVRAGAEVFDAVVVGLGAVGSAAVYQLARRGAQVLGIDRYAPPHARGSSHGDTRITRLAIGEGAQYTPLVLRSHQIWRDIEQRSGASLLSVTGGLIISSRARQAETHVANFFDNTLEVARRHGIEHEILDAPAIRARFPQFRVRDNEFAYFEPGAGFVRPEACVRAQLALALRDGAKLRTGERVMEYASADGLVRVRTDQASYAAKQLIIAAGSWLPELLDADLARHFRITRQVLHWFALAAPPEQFLPPRFPVWIWELQERSNVIYGFPAIDGASGGVKIATEQYAAATAPDTIEREVGPDEIRAMHAALVAPYLPGVAATSLKTAVCMYTCAPDFHFVIDRHPRMPQVIIASPCSGHGFKHSAAIGEALAQWVLDGQSALDLGAFAFDRILRKTSSESNPARPL